MLCAAFWTSLLRICMCVSMCVCVCVCVHVCMCVNVMGKVCGASEFSRHNSVPTAQRQELQQGMEFRTTSKLNNEIFIKVESGLFTGMLEFSICSGSKLKRANT